MRMALRIVGSPASVGAAAATRLRRREHVYVRAPRSSKRQYREVEGIEKELTGPLATGDARRVVRHPIHSLSLQLDIRSGERAANAFLPVPS